MDPARRAIEGDRFLLASNLLMLVIALWRGWPLSSLLLPFWLQSVAIGFFQGVRMLRLKSFSTDGFTSNGKRVPETRAGKISTVVFFAVHYGFFHLGYLVFLVEFSSANTDPGYALYWWITVAALLLAELNAHRDDVRRDVGGKPNLGSLMFLPYLRVVPMHLMIFIGAALGDQPLAVIAFLLLKTASDWLMQICERKIEDSGRSRKT